MGILCGIYRMKKPISRRTKAIAEDNYFRNLSFESVHPCCGLINDQRGKTGKGCSLGLYPVSYNGCEAIAIHNALTLLGKKSTLAESIRSIQLCGGMWRKGLWGSDPARLGCVLKRRYGVKSSYFFNPEKPLSDGVYIISFWNSPKNLSCGLHTVALKVKGGGMTFYNDGGQGMKERRFDGRKLPQRYSQGFILGIRCFPAEKSPHGH